MTADVSEAIRRHVAQLVAEAPRPTDEQIVQLLQWFGPQRHPRPTADHFAGETQQAAS